MFLCPGREREGTKISGSWYLQSTPRKTNASKVETKLLLCSEKPFTANWERNSMACAIQKHIFLLMRLHPKPQEIWFSKEACICSPKLFMPNYRGNSLVWEGSTFSPNKEKEKI